jgi:2-phospho-L-lactate/phosphoenolpyruvate guanylyltransferase
MGLTTKRPKRSSRAATWVIVLVKDLDSAKQRLGAVLDPKARRELALRNAERAIRAATAGDERLVVAGSREVVEIAERLGADTLLEPRQEGQNKAAERGIAHAIERGASAVLILSSDLPLVTPEAVRDVLDAAGLIAPPAAVAVPALGRGGTNALYLNPPVAIALRFGADSLAAFRHEAESKGVTFATHSSEAMALDLDEPADLVYPRSAI